MRNLVIITGASRGIGRACALAFGKEVTFDPLHVALVARNWEGLTETERQVRTVSGAKHMTISKHSCDLSNLDTLEDNVRFIFDTLSTGTQYDQAILINNAGSLGYIGVSSNLPSPKDIQKTIDFNVTSCIWLSSYFVQYFAKRLCVSKVIVVNMSSLCGISPFKTLALYCSGKAARDMFHHTLGVEEEQQLQQQPNGSRVRVLNYAPGAIDTTMTEELETSMTLDSNLSQFYNKSRDEKTYVTPMETASNLLNIILKDTYKNGLHIDYWDDE
jgi:sepiapterin reductase